MTSARLTDTAIDPAAELQAFMTRTDGSGAVVTFTGIVRSRDEAGGAIGSLFLDHYPGMTEASLEAIAADVGSRPEIQAVAVVHRCGLVAAGETIVFVAAAARHRREAFLAADELMDRLKTQAMFWKREAGLDGERWIEPSQCDHSDAARWSKPCPE